ncbi:hypothetical protein N1851_013726 [Merluccius polli]|uniref:Uncharacterized protein n=1 Tax=Merluccius polli TaxID=89951 RepID=A0AA47P1H5_MERPO|nr:hypothetical protein N1851_013726 [Merluccius polli]
MNRICDKGQPWRSPTLTGNKSDLLPGTDSPYQGVRYPVLPENPPQDSPRDTVECLLQVHKAHVDWLGKLPCTLKDPAEGVELVHYSTAWTKTTLLLLNPRFGHSCAPLGLPVPACCLRSPTGQKGPIGLLQFDGIPHRRCPPAGSGITTMAGTDHLAATAPVSCLNNGGTEHGPLGLNVPRLPRYMVKALPEVGVEALSDRRLCQMFPADPHNTFGPARSDRHPPPPLQPTHHQVVIS